MLVTVLRILARKFVVLGVLRIGAVAMPRIEKLTGKNLAYGLDHSGARAVVCRIKKQVSDFVVNDRIVAHIAVDGAPAWTDEDEVDGY